MDFSGDFLISVANIFISFFGFITSVLLLVDNRVKNRNIKNVMSLCLMGIGWSVFLYSSIFSFGFTDIFYTLGRFCFLVSFLIIFYNKVAKIQIETFLSKINKSRGEK